MTTNFEEVHTIKNTTSFKINHFKEFEKPYFRSKKNILKRVFMKNAWICFIFRSVLTIKAIDYTSNGEILNKIQRLSWSWSELV